MADSGFGIHDGVIACTEKGCYPATYVKKRGHWPRGVPGDHIDGHFAGAELGHCETLVQTYQNQRFLVHCCRDSKYVSKIMATHGMLEEIQDHPTWRRVDGQWKTFKYAEPFSRYSRAKHWVDDHNNRRHDPIGLEEVWGTRWWPSNVKHYLIKLPNFYQNFHTSIFTGRRYFVFLFRHLLGRATAPGR